MSFNDDFFKDFDRDFDKSYKRTKRAFIGIAAVSTMLYMAFWGFVVFVIVMLLKHFGII